MSVPYETAHRELLDVIKERDEARRLADLLAEELKWAHLILVGNTHDAGLVPGCETEAGCATSWTLAAWDARNWR